jgi:transaldolase
VRATRLLHDAGQSLWLDNISRDLLESGTLERYIRELIPEVESSSEPALERDSSTNALIRPIAP